LTVPHWGVVVKGQIPTIFDGKEIAKEGYILFSNLDKSFWETT
jgi:hypothetical protein